MKTIYYHLLIDASKSMSRYWAALVKHLSAHYKTTRKFEALYLIELKKGIGVFNIDTIFLELIVQSPAILKTIKPDGRTALYDAIVTNIDFVAIFELSRFSASLFIIFLFYNMLSFKSAIC